MQDAITMPPALRLPIAQLVPREKNSNHMTSERYALLVKSISTLGFLQPILVRPLDNGQYEIVDGAHRVKAAKEAGLTEVTAILRDDTSEELAKAAQLGFNAIRGNQNLAEVATVVVDLVDAGWSITDLGLTGYTEGELDEMVRQANQTSEDVMRGADVSAPSNADGDDTDKTYNLDLVFDSKADMTRVRKLLRKLAGKGNDLSVGALALVAKYETAGILRKE